MDTRQEVDDTRLWVRVTPELRAMAQDVADREYDGNVSVLVRQAVKQFLGGKQVSRIFRTYTHEHVKALYDAAEDALSTLADPVTDADRERLVKSLSDAMLPFDDPVAHAARMVYAAMTGEEVA